MAVPTTFADIPTEVVEKISSNLKSPEDFINFRSSSRKAWKESSDTFAKLFFVHKRILWTEHALNAFAEMTTHEKFSTLFRKLEHLTFCAPPRLEEIDARHLTESSILSKVLAYNHFCNQHLSFIEKDWEEGHHDLRVSFLALRKMRQNIGISLEGLASTDWYDGSPSKNPAWGFTRFIRHSAPSQAISKSRPHKNEESRYVYSTDLKQENMLGMVLYSISSARLDIEFLGLDWQWNTVCNILLDERFFVKLLTGLPGLETCLRNLHTLRLKVDIYWNYLDDEDPSFEQGLVRFWSACSNLKTFRYEGEYEGDLGHTFLRKVLPLLCSEKLKNLELESSFCSSEAICAVLRRHRSTLKCVRLHVIDLGDEGSWERIFVGLRKLDQLEHLSIENIYGQDQDEDWCIIFLPNLSWLERMASGLSPDSDDHPEMQDKESHHTLSIEMDRDQIAELLPTLQTHLVYVKRNV